MINAARGGVVNENDLNKALNEKLISFAGIDVFEKEPPDKDNPLLKNKRVVLSPHAATFTKPMVIENAVLAGPVTFTSTVTVTGTLVVV